MKARKVTEFEFVIWDGSDEAFEKIKALTAIEAKVSFKLTESDGESIGTIMVPLRDGWEVAYKGDYIFADSSQKRRLMGAEDFLATYKVIDPKPRPFEDGNADC